MSAKHDSNPPQHSPRLLLPAAVVAALTALIDDLGGAPDYRRPALRTLRDALCRLYRLPVPNDRANESELAQQLAEEDGDAIEDTV